jgi:hypothetical protein
MLRSSGLCPLYAVVSIQLTREQEARLARSPPSTREIELFGSCILNRRRVFLVLLPSQLIQPARGGSWVVGRGRRVREQRGGTLVPCLLV